jgi:hypothetical protein
MGKFRDALRDLINGHSKENGSNTPDFILARYLDVCLQNFDLAVKERERWYGRHDKPGALEARRERLIETDPSVPDHPAPASD